MILVLSLVLSTGNREMMIIARIIVRDSFCVYRKDLIVEWRQDGPSVFANFLPGLCSMTIYYTILCRCFNVPEVYILRRLVFEFRISAARRRRIFNRYLYATRLPYTYCKLIRFYCTMNSRDLIALLFQLRALAFSS